MWEPCPTPGRSWAPSGPKEALPCLGGRGHTEAAWGCSWRKSCNRAATGSCGFQEELGGSNLVSSFLGRKGSIYRPRCTRLAQEGVCRGDGEKTRRGGVEFGHPCPQQHAHGWGAGGGTRIPPYTGALGMWAQHRGAQPQTQGGFLLPRAPPGSGGGCAGASVAGPCRAPGACAPDGCRAAI